MEEVVKRELNRGVKIKKWGNGAAIHLPANLINSTSLSIHSVVNIDIIDDQIVIKAPR